MHSSNCVWKGREWVWVEQDNKGGHVRSGGRAALEGVPQSSTKSISYATEDKFPQWSAILIITIILTTTVEQSLEGAAWWEIVWVLHFTSVRSLLPSENNSDRKGTFKWLGKTFACLTFKGWPFPLFEGLPSWNCTVASWCGFQHWWTCHSSWWSQVYARLCWNKTLDTGQALKIDLPDLISRLPTWFIFLAAHGFSPIIYIKKDRSARPGTGFCFLPS